MHFSSVLGLVASASLAVSAATIAAPRPVYIEDILRLNMTLTPIEKITEPCGKIQTYLTAAAKSHKKLNLWIRPSLAYACLTSVPLNSTNAVTLIYQLKKFVQFQSTIAWAANPPNEVERQPVDLMTGLDEISKTAESGGYKNNYEFEAAIRTLLNLMRDGHLGYSSNCLEGAFTFGHLHSLVQFAATPYDMPKVYSASDIPVKGYTNKTIEYQPSPLKSIDNTPVADYLSNYIENVNLDGKLHDPDARYNSIFESRGSMALAPGAFAHSILYPGADNMTITYENGTTNVIQLLAVVSANFTNITNGDEYYQVQCMITPEEEEQEESTPTMGPNSTSSVVPTSTATAKATALPKTSRVPGYPLPIGKTNTNLISSYMLNDTLSVGIIACHSFLAAGVEPAVEFQEFVKNTISEFKQKGVKRVIIDVTGNGGGTIALAFDMMKQFFPKTEPFATNNQRATEASKILYQALGENVVQPIDTGNTSSWDEEQLSVRTSLLASPFSYYYQEDNKETHFTSWQGAFGPVEVRGDNFTNYIKWDLASEGTFGLELNITAGGDSRNSTYEEPWSSQDIVILTNGICASSCTLFTEAMKEAGVRTFTYGGRPQKGEMQAIGGVEGSMLQYFETILALSNFVIELAPEQAEAGNWSEILPEPLIYAPNSVPNDVHLGSVNLRNSFRNSSETPLEFIYDAANWRIHQTKEMYQDVTVLWDTVAEIVWGGKQTSHAVEGGLASQSGSARNGGGSGVLVGLVSVAVGIVLML